MSMKSDMDEINYVYKKLEESCPRTLEFILENYKKIINLIAGKMHGNGRNIIICLKIGKDR